MKAKLKIARVTKSDIAKGGRLQPDCCPIARAVSRRLGFAVWFNGSEFRRGGAPGYHDAPLKCKTFVRLFDGGQPVKPFSFIIPHGL